MGANSSSRSDAGLLTADDDAAMEQLDELCLLNIFEYLPLADQVNMLQCHERFRHLLGNIWRRQLTRIDLNLLQNQLSKYDFQFLLKQASQRLLQLKLSYLDRDKFSILIQQRFPKLCLLQVDVLPPFFVCHRLRHQLRKLIQKSKVDENTNGHNNGERNEVDKAAPLSLVHLSQRDCVWSFGLGDVGTGNWQ